MSGAVNVLALSEGASVTAPGYGFQSANNIPAYATTAAYVTAKGSAAAAGDIFENSTTGKLNFYNGTSWLEIGDSAAVFQTKTTTYTALITDDYIYAATASAWVLTLPAGVLGKEFTIIKNSSDLNALTITPTAGNVGEYGTTTATTKIHTIGETIKLIWDGTNWLVTSRKIPSIDTSYTPTFTGFGTVASLKVYWRRNGQGLYVRGTATTGTTPASTVGRIALPSGLTTNADGVHCLVGEITGNSGSVVTGIVAQVALFLHSAQTTAVSLTQLSYGAATHDLTEINTDNFYGNAQVFSFFFNVPIVGWNG